MSLTLELGQTRAADIVFSSCPIVGSFTCGRLRIAPLPPEAPRPATVVGKHPGMLEISFGYHPNRLVREARGTRALQEAQLLLTTLCRGFVYRSDRRTRSEWVLPDDPDSAYCKATFLQLGYWFPNPDLSSEAFDNHSETRAPVEPAQEHFRLTNRLEVQSIPDDLSEKIEKADELGSDGRKRLLTACYWFNAAKQTDSSQSLAYTALIFALESLIEKVNVKRCSCCNTELFGVTDRFRELLKRYGADDKTAKLLYEMRSNIVHGKDIFDQDKYFWGFTPKAIEQDHYAEVATLLARNVIRNWLSDQARSEARD